MKVNISQNIVTLQDYYKLGLLDKCIEIKSFEPNATKIEN